MKQLRYASRASGRPFSFSPEESREIDSLLGRYPTKRAALLPVLWIVQARAGWIPSEAVAEVARVLDLSEAYVDGVLTFYTMYSLHPIGKYDLQFCTSISCHLNGADSLLEHCEKKLGIGVGETTPDGKFTITEVECIAGCDRAPSMQVNDQYHEPMTPEKLDLLLARLSRET
ncbi:MAG: NADH-quinone oxidoreductase subunit NuoE [Thermoanaerobaculia bacterium]